MDKKYQLDYIWNKIKKLYIKIKEYNLIEVIGAFLGILVPIAIFLLNLVEMTVKNGYEKYFGLTGVNIIWNTFSFWSQLIIYCVVIAFTLIGNIVLETCLQKAKIIEKTYIKNRRKGFNCYIILYNAAIFDVIINIFDI